ncbi:hypothetical protein FQN57_001501 [Myotisia sp. PD_48]|nr:hypothetical protein FQN57_001501 [Myotisia sp. PD_48]
MARYSPYIYDFDLDSDYYDYEDDLMLRRYPRSGKRRNWPYRGSTYVENDYDYSYDSDVAGYPNDNLHPYRRCSCPSSRCSPAQQCASCGSVRSCNSPGRQEIHHHHHLIYPTCEIRAGAIYPRIDGPQYSQQPNMAGMLVDRPVATRLTAMAGALPSTALALRAPGHTEAMQSPLAQRLCDCCARAQQHHLERHLMEGQQMLPRRGLTHPSIVRAQLLTQGRFQR